MKEDFEFFNNLLKDLVGQRLSSITFILDYWQLGFDDFGFSVMTTIKVDGVGEIVRDGDRDFRNRLCECITHNVVQAQAANDVVYIAFDNGYKIELSFRKEDYVGPEALHFFHPRLPSIMVV